MAQFCAEYIPSLLCLGRAFLYLSFAIAMLTALLAILKEVITLLKPPTTGLVADADGNTAATFLDSLKGLIEALASAPAWFAMFLAGLLLIWAVVDKQPEICKPASPSAEVPASG